MGFGFPAAIGAKVAKPYANVISITGDGGFLMNSQELATISEYDIPVVICILTTELWEWSINGKTYTMGRGRVKFIWERVLTLLN